MRGGARQGSTRTPTRTPTWTSTRGRAGPLGFAKQAVGREAGGPRKEPVMSDTRTNPTGGSGDGDTSVLANLDSTEMKGMYWYLALLACIGGFLFGYDTSVIGSVLGFIPYHLNS